TVMPSYPQVLINVRMAEKIHDPIADLATAIEAVEQQLGASGRVLVRASGTEPLIRVMVEAADADTAQTAARHLASAVIAVHGGAIEGAH
ncbi:MAG: hypothetical protein RLZ67_792, partial [Actinomycetota bacterium]